jgi:probable O-glycosylation ligase (exosortase A-associated)
VIVVSIGFYGAKGGLWTLVTGGVGRVFGPANSYIEDNNALAVATIMAIPLMHYLQLTTSRRITRWVLTVVMLLCAVSVLGSYSRGALVAVAAMGTYLWWKGKNKLPLLLVLLLCMPVALQLMPEKWYERMETITTYEDSSAQSRLKSWRTMVNIANARPFVGGGFEISHPDVYARFLPDQTAVAQAAHSIYFQALGEHGYVGLTMYLFLLVGAWLKAGSIAPNTVNRPDLAWARQFSEMVQVTLVGFAVGGAFISLVNFDVPYYLIAILIATAALVKRESREVEQQAVTPPSLRHGLRANNGIVKRNV